MVLNLVCLEIMGDHQKMPFLLPPSQQDSNYCIWDANNEFVLSTSSLGDFDTGSPLTILRNTDAGCTDCFAYRRQRWEVAQMLVENRDVA